MTQFIQSLWRLRQLAQCSSAALGTMIAMFCHGCGKGHTMTHTYAQLFYHVVWSTKNREALITPNIKKRLYEYIGGIVKNYDATLMQIGGMSDHVHLLIKGRADLQLSGLVRQIKSRSTKWVAKEFTQPFYWQEGYGVFSVSYSILDQVVDYIKNQEKHHTKRTFDQEYIMLLEKNRISYDQRFVLG